MKDEIVTTPSPPGRLQFFSRRGCLLYAAGVVTGSIVLPLLFLVALLIGGARESLQPTPAPPGQPDITMALSRSYLQRSAERSIASRANMLRLDDPVITLASHAQGGALMTVRGRLDLPLADPHLVADFHLAPIDGQLRVATERVALGGRLNISIPGQSFIKNWLDELVNREVQARIRANPSVEVLVVDVSANPEELIVKAMLNEQ